MYRVEPMGDGVAGTIAALPDELLGAFAELWTALETDPRRGDRPYVADRPDGSRSAAFGPDGEGLVIYGIVEREQRVAIWQVTFY